MSDSIDEASDEETTSRTIIEGEIGRILLVITGALMMQFGIRLWGLIAPSHWFAVIVTMYTFATALGLFIVALMDVDLERYGYYIAGAVLLVLFVDVATIVWLRPGTRFGTDALLFSRYSVDLTLLGRNPYANSMEPATRIYNANILHVTPTIDGDAIDSLSYPAGMVVWFLPQAMLDVGEPPMMLTLLLVATAIVAFLILESPPELAIVGIIVALAAKNILVGAIGGLLDVLWLLPLLVSMREWHAGRLDRAALAFGFAAGTKQTVWPIAAFLAIWLWADADSRSAFIADARTTLSYGALGFGVLNLPFILWNPKMWVYGVLTPIGGGAPMIHQGVGPTLLSIADVYALPKTYHTILVVLMTVVLLALYTLYWDRAKWVAWVVPPAILFWYHRSLTSYYVFFAPVAYYAVLCQTDLRKRQWAPVDTLVQELAVLIVRLDRTLVPDWDGDQP